MKKTKPKTLHRLRIQPQLCGRWRRRCPTAKVVGSSLLRGWRLMFRGGSHSAVATVERMPGHTVPVLIWRLQPSDEQALDVYEGWPRLYRKETIRLTVNGRRALRHDLHHERARPPLRKTVQFLSEHHLRGLSLLQI